MKQFGEKFSTAIGIVLLLLILPFLLLASFLYLIFRDLHARMVHFFSGSKLKYETEVTSSCAFKIERTRKKHKCKYRYEANSSMDGSDRFILEGGIILIDGRGANHYCFNHSGLLSVRRFQKEPLPLDEWLRAETEKSGTECFLCFDDSRDHVRKRVFKALMSHPRTVALSELSDWLKSEQFLLLIDQKGV